MHPHAGAAYDDSAGTLPFARKYAIDILPHGVSVSVGFAFETGQALRHSFGQKTQFSSAVLRGSSSGSARIICT